MTRASFSPSPQERVVLVTRPSILAAFVLFAPFSVPAIFLLAMWYLLKLATGDDFHPAFVIGIWMLGISFVLGIILRWSRRYTLTNRRIITEAGVVRRVRGELLLIDVAELLVTRGLIEQISATGSLSVSKIGGDSPSLSWLMVSSPEAVLAEIRKCVDEARGIQSQSGSLPPDGPTLKFHGGPTNEPPKETIFESAQTTPPPSRLIPIIGLVGGIGAGKSTVAKELGKLGCKIVDADADVRAVLEDPEIRDELVSWWGQGILNDDGKINRKAVAGIVFASDAERRRLEALVHPRIKSDRPKLIEQAQASGATGVVIDAPLLFEAGSDAQCDAVLFVSAPPAVRLQRVQERGWSQEEMDRRESAQISLDEKKRRSRYLIENDGDLAALHLAVARAFEAIRIDLSARTQSAGGTDQSV